MFGFRLFDVVMYNGEICYIHGRRTSGYFDIRKLDGTRGAASANHRELKLVRHSRNIDIR